MLPLNRLRWKQIIWILEGRMTTTKQKQFTIFGKESHVRISSRNLEEQLQEAVAKGQRNLLVHANGQHGIGGRLWRAGDKPVRIRLEGQSGQRVGSMGFPNTRIDIMGPASDDVGWLNGGAEIVVHGHAANGVGNAMAQGKIYVAGNIGARGMTMTKHNPRFDPPELWVLGSVGDYFAEFMAGGIAVVCGHEPQSPRNVLGYRPLVGMVSGKIFFRGPHGGFNQSDAKQIPIDDNDWQWLRQNLRRYLACIKKPDLFKQLAIQDQWQLLVARPPREKMSHQRRSMTAFHQDVWDQELGQGGLIGDLTTVERSPIPVITTGDLRRYIPVWENHQYMAPCEASCPTGIPVQERWRLVREGRIDEAVDLALAYTPFPASVCGYLCPNPCMQACTRQIGSMLPVDVTQLGKASIDAGMPDLATLSGKKIAVIGGGPGGISAAWQLRLKGHEAVIYDRNKTLGGKMVAAIPHSRIPEDVVQSELERMRKILPHVHLQQDLKQADILRLQETYDFLVVAAGAQQARMLPVPGRERLVTANDFLAQAKADNIKPGKRVVIIGAGNVGCDVATEAHRLGAKEITLVDIQKPLAFGKEKEAAEAVGVQFRWPCFTEKILKKGLKLTTGEVLPANMVIVAVGDQPDLSFLPSDVATEKGFVVVDDKQQTTNPQIFAIGDMVAPGLLTDAIGAGRKAARAIIDILAGRRPMQNSRQMLDRQRISLEYFDPRIIDFDGVDHCGSQCSSCGACRDCGLCISICPEAAISKQELEGSEYEYVVDASKCIGCGFCGAACPCGIWNLIENDPLV
jgi:NADPH-dependent glutamate synthase beta subunit-like oxidoreductase/glutamate synthase domain-containing protein 3/Pyruvate/2-oxoacid:ferredoxin oxidoreductase delta subunit